VGGGWCGGCCGRDEWCGGGLGWGGEGGWGGWGGVGGGWCVSFSLRGGGGGEEVGGGWDGGVFVFFFFFCFGFFFCFCFFFFFFVFFLGPRPGYLLGAGRWGRPPRRPTRGAWAVSPAQVRGEAAPGPRPRPGLAPCVPQAGGPGGVYGGVPFLACEPGPGSRGRAATPRSIEHRRAARGFFSRHGSREALGHGTRPEAERRHALRLPGIPRRLDIGRRSGLSARGRAMGGAPGRRRLGGAT